MVSTRWLFVCSCIALVTSAFTFVVRGDILQEMGNYFHLTQAQKGGIEGAVFFGMAVSMFGGGFICDLLGMKRIMWLAFASHLIGSLGTIFAPQFESIETTYYYLFALSFLMGCGNGFTEVAINPLVATLYPTQKTHYLNILHAWWPGGLVIGGLSAQFLVRGLLFSEGGTSENTLFGMQLWQVSLWLITLPTLLYGAMLLPAVFPRTERVESGVSTADMFKECLRPLFIIWAICMLMTAATELGPQKWQESVMRATADVSGTLILVYTSGMMFVLRHFAGPIAHRLSPIGMLCGSSVLAGIGLFLLSFANNTMTAFAYATIFGLGIAYYWPTMLGVTAERFAKGGALALALMGSVGNLSISRVLPAMGGIVDVYAVRTVEQNYPDLAPELLKTNDQGEPIAVDVEYVASLPDDAPARQAARAAERVGFSMAFRWVSILPGILVVVFGAIVLWDKSRGGYRPEILLSRKEHEELMTGGVEGPIE